MWEDHPDDLANNVKYVDVGDWKDEIIWIKDGLYSFITASLQQSQHIDQCRLLQYGLEPVLTSIGDNKSNISELQTLQALQVETLFWSPLCLMLAYNGWMCHFVHYALAHQG